MKLTSLYNSTLLSESSIGDTVQEHNPNLDSIALLNSNGTLRRTPTGYETGEVVFVQPTPPNFNGQKGIWVQTGLPNNGYTIWIEDGA